MKAGKMNSNLIESKDLRNFGILIGFVVGPILGVILPFYKTKTFDLNFLGIGVCILLISISIPKILFYPYKVWMKIGEILGWVNSRIILGIIFFVLFVPVGLIRRIANRDTLKRSLDYTSNSYWIIPQKRESNHMERPF